MTMTWPQTLLVPDTLTVSLANNFRREFEEGTVPAVSNLPEYPGETLIQFRIPFGEKEAFYSFLRHFCEENNCSLEAMLRNACPVARVAAGVTVAVNIPESRLIH